MWKRLLVVSAVSAAMSSMALAAPLTVGFSQVGSESGWRAAETNVAKSEAEKRGITLKIADGQQKQENQIKAVRSFVAQGVDAIFIAPVVATGKGILSKRYHLKQPHLNKNGRYIVGLSQPGIGTTKWLLQISGFSLYT